MKNTKLGFVLLIVIIIFSVISIMNDTLYKDLISTITALIGMFAIWYQLKKEKDISEAEFIVNLNNSFVENEGIKKIYDKLRCNVRNVDANPFNEDDRKYIVDYLTYFETIYILYKKGIFKISEIDEMFAYRFFLLINDKYIQDIELSPNGEYYFDLYDFYKVWKEYRQKKSKEIIKIEHCFEEFYKKRLCQEEKKLNKLEIEIE